MTDRLLGVVLCGGRSSRMGQDKASLPHPNGGTFLSHATERLRELCEEVCVAGTVQGETALRIIADRMPYAGPAGGIASALGIANSESFDGCLVTPVDMPRLTIDDLRELCATWLEDPQQLVCGKTDTHVQPLVAIYPTRLLDAMRDLDESEDRSLYRWIERSEATFVSLASDSCHNINTREDYLRGF